MQLTGGDPFMRKDLLQILQYVKSMRFPLVTLSTSSLLLNEVRIGWLEGTVDAICHSLDGFALEHDVLRGIKCWDQSVKAIRLSSERGFRTYVCACLTPPLLERIEEFMDLLVSLGVKQVKLAQIGDVGRKEVPSDWRGSQLDPVEIHERVESLKGVYSDALQIQQSFTYLVMPPSIDRDGIVCDPLGDLYPVIGYLPKHWICGRAAPGWRLEPERLADYQNAVGRVLRTGLAKIGKGKPVNWWTLLHDELVSSAPVKVYSL